MRTRQARRTAPGGLVVLAGAAAFFSAGIGAAILALLTSVFGGLGGQCGSPVGGSPAGGAPASATQPAGPGGGIVLGPPGTGQLVGATEYGGPGDPSSGVLGSSGA